MTHVMMWTSVPSFMNLSKDSSRHGSWCLPSQVMEEKARQRWEERGLREAMAPQNWHLIFGLVRNKLANLFSSLRQGRQGPLGTSQRLPLVPKWRILRWSSGMQGKKCLHPLPWIPFCLPLLLPLSPLFPPPLLFLILETKSL